MRFWQTPQRPRPRLRPRMASLRVRPRPCQGSTSTCPCPNEGLPWDRGHGQGLASDYSKPCPSPDRLPAVAGHRQAEAMPSHGHGSAWMAVSQGSARPRPCTRVSHALAKPSAIAVPWAKRESRFTDSQTSKLSTNMLEQHCYLGYLVFASAAPIPGSVVTSPVCS